MQGTANLYEDIVQPGVVAIWGRSFLLILAGQAEQVIPRYVLHREEMLVHQAVNLVIPCVDYFAKIIYFDQVWVAQLGHGSKFIFELRQAAFADGIDAHQFKRHHLVVAQRVLHQVYSPHTALA